MPPPPLNMSMSIRTATEEEDGLAGEVLGMSYGEITDSYSKANVAIHGLVWLMSSPSINDSAKASAAAAVSALAADGTENKDRIARTDGAIEALIHLSVAGGDKSRASATMAMANLVEDHVENKLLVASATPFFPAVTAVMRTGTEKARWHAARLLASVAMMPELRDTIGAEKGTLDELVRLCRSGTEDAMCSAACALANLTDSNEANWERMAHVQKGFSALIGVAGGGSMEARAHAVRALANLAVPHANKTLIAKTPRALQVLVEALEMDRGPTQSNAAAAIGNLAHDHSENKDRIAQEPSSLVALVSSLRNGSDDCRRNAAAAMANICHEHAENIELIMRTSDSLHSLVWCLWNARDDCRNNAACCLANLAASSMKNQWAIAKVERSVDALIDCCRRGGDFTVANAAGALANLAERHAANKRLIGDAENAIAVLVKVACTGRLPSAVSNAACALANLAAEDRLNKRAIAASPGALQVLVQLVAASPADTQSNAACAIANIVADEDDIKSALAEMPYAFGSLVELLRTGTDSCKVNACRAIANAVSWHDDNKAQVATVRGSIPALVNLVAEDGPLSPGHTAAALALANLTDAHLKNSRTTAVEEGGLEALVRIAGHAEEEGRVHAMRCLANLAEPYDNRELIGATEGALETLLLALGSSNDTLCTTAAFALAKLTESVAANVVALGETFNAIEKLTECVAKGSRRARSNAAVCLCHLTARRHGLSVKVVRTAGTVRALADAAVAEIPIEVDTRETDFENGAYAAGVTLEKLERYVTSEQVVEEREVGRSTDDIEAHEDAKRCCAFAIASMVANKGPEYDHIKPVTKIKGVLASLVWILANTAVDPNSLRVFDANGHGVAPDDSGNGVPQEQAPALGAQGSVADITSRDGMSAVILPRVNAAASLANLADADSGNIVSIIRTPGAIAVLVDSVRQEEWQHLRYHAARALANMSTFYGARTAIAESPGSIVTLVNVLQAQKQDAAKVQVARTLGNLAANHILNKGRIANTTQSLALLVRAITFGSPECRAQAARALGEVCENHTPNAIAVESIRGSLDGAIMMLTEGLKQVRDEERRWDPAVEAAERMLPHPEAAANAMVPDDFSLRRDALDKAPWMLVEACFMLTHLAVTDSLRNAIGQRPGVLELLLRALQVGLHVARVNAAKALAALACNSEAVSQEICNVDQSLSVLLHICDELPVNGDDLRSNAVKTLVNLVDAFLESSELICQIPHSLPAVINMIQTGTEAAKGNACYLLGNLLELSARVVEQTVAIPGSVEALVDVLMTGTDFAMGNASRALGNIVDENTVMAALVVANERALTSLVKVARDGRDKSRGNACQALGKLCEPHSAVDAHDLVTISKHRTVLGDMQGALLAMLRTAIDCEPDVQIQATHGLSLVIAEHKHNCDIVAGIDAALEDLIVLINKGGHKAVAGACRVIANLCDVYGASPLAALKFAHTEGGLDALVGVLLRIQQDRVATVEATRAFANLTEKEKEDGNDLSVAQVALQAEGFPSLSAFVMQTCDLLLSLVRTCYEGADEAKEHAMRCLSNMAGTGNALSAEITEWKDTVAAMVHLCKTGTDLARAHATQAVLNLAVSELDLLQNFMDGVFHLRALVEEALNPPPVVLASFVMNGVFSFSNKQKDWIADALSRTLNFPKEDINVLKVAIFGTNIGCIVHLLLQLPHDCGDLGTELGHRIVEQSLNGDIARELQAMGIKVSRTTLAEDPHVTKKNVFKGRAENMAPDIELGEKGLLQTSPTRSIRSAHSKEEPPEGSAIKPSTPNENALYKPQTDEELNTIANQTTYMQMLSNRELALALRRNAGDVDEAWADLCEAAAVPGAAETLATQKASEEEPVVVAEEREGGVGGSRRVVAQADAMHGAFEILPRATRLCEEVDLLDTMLKVASGMVVWDGEGEMGAHKRELLHVQPAPTVVAAHHASNNMLCVLAGWLPAPQATPVFGDTMTSMVDILRYGSPLSREHVSLALLNLCSGDHRFSRHLKGQRALSTISVAMKDGTLQGRINACSLLACLSSDVEHGQGFGSIDGMLEWAILLGEEGEGEDGVMAAREVAGLLLSNLAANKENAQQIADTHRAVSMLANCVEEGNVVVGTLACRALCNMPLSENLPESGNVAHVPAQWFVTSTYLTQEFMGDHDFCDTRDAPKGLIEILLTGRPQSQIEAAGVLLKLSGEPACMQLLCETPGTFQVLVDMLGLTSHMASESSSALCYRIALERQYRPELGGTGKCLEELANVMDTGTLIAQHMAGGCLLNLIDSPDNQSRLIEAHNVLNILLRLGEESVNQMVRRCAVGVLRQVVDGVGGFKAMRIKRRVEGLQLR